MGNLIEVRKFQSKVRPSGSFHFQVVINKDNCRFIGKKMYIAFPYLVKLYVQGRKMQGIEA